MPTLQDVARKAGVSTATVSKVLSNTPYFTEATRLRVMQAVEELGYRPHLAARALSTGKTHIIAVVFPYVYEMMFTDPLVLSILQGVEEACYEHGYNMLLSTPRLSANGPDEPYQQLIQSGYLDGMIAIDNIPLASALRPALEHGLPGVTLGYHKSTYSVCSDDFSGGSQLMEHVLKLGHRDIGIIGVPDEMHFSILERLRGMQAVADGAGISLRKLPRQDGDFSIASGAACVTRLLEQHPNLTAIICVNDRMAMGAIQQARLLGRDVPSDLTIVGYDNIPTAASFSPPLTTIDQQAQVIGRTGAQMLFEVLDKKKPEPVSVPVHLVVRQSSALLPDQRKGV